MMRRLLTLDRYAADLASCDSMSWSLDGRYTRGCGCSCHRPHKTEANCVHHATRWHTDTLRRLGAIQLALPIGLPTVGCSQPGTRPAGSGPR
jgi:hypothetical protein